MTSRNRSAIQKRYLKTKFLVNSGFNLFFATITCAYPSLLHCHFESDFDEILEKVLVLIDAVANWELDLSHCITFDWCILLLFSLV